MQVPARPTSPAVNSPKQKDLESSTGMRIRWKASETSETPRLTRTCWRMVSASGVPASTFAGNSTSMPDSPRP